MFKGSCLCGEVRYEIRGELARTSHCHCTMCQKQHGAAFASYANVASSDYHLVQGRDALTLYRSSDAVERTFCKVCGANISWQHDDHKHRIAIAPVSCVRSSLTEKIDENRARRGAKRSKGGSLASICNDGWRGFHRFSSTKLSRETLSTFDTPYTHPVTHDLDIDSKARWLP